MGEETATGSSKEHESSTAATKDEDSGDDEEKKDEALPPTPTPTPTPTNENANTTTNQYGTDDAPDETNDTPEVNDNHNDHDEEENASKNETNSCPDLSEIDEDAFLVDEPDSMTDQEAEAATKDDKEDEGEAQQDANNAEVSANKDDAVDAIASPTKQQQQQQQQPPQGLQHKFEPGDHVIRWEMLPIVWPIQIHGIVLEATPNYVQICDFGLTAQPRDDLAEEDKTGVKKKKNFAAAWEKVKPPDNTKKQRITVHIITSQDELKAWSKVHYGRNLLAGLGMGGDNNNSSSSKGGAKKGGHGHGDKSAASSDGEDDTFDPDHNANDGHHRRPIRNKVAPWWSKFKTSVGKIRPKENDTDKIEPSTAAEDKTEQAVEASLTGDGAQVETTTTTTTTTTAPLDSPTKKIATTISEESQSPKKDKKVRTQKHHTPNKKKPEAKNKLPKSDPPKLVLARTRFLLQHGESVLPPYHVFQSNSECIAVFCKTGYWSTLQASVFLHSTAIGNAKSATAVTLGVAASVPLLAPAIAGLGLAMVGAPYVILNQSKEKWNLATARLTDAFWAQAPNEVFVECIEHWSQLCNNDDNDNDNDNDKNDDSSEKDESEETNVTNASKVESLKNDSAQDHQKEDDEALNVSGKTDTEEGTIVDETKSDNAEKTKSESSFRFFSV